MESEDTKSLPTKMTPSEFVGIVNECLKEYYSNPRSRFGESYCPNVFSGKVITKKEIEEFTRSRGFERIFHDLAHAGHWPQAIHFLLNYVDYHIPTIDIVQKILDVMLVLENRDHVIEAQLYILQLITNYPPNNEDMAQYFWEVLKEEEEEQKRVTSTKEPCGSFISVISHFEIELGNIDQLNNKSCSAAINVSCIDSKHDGNESNEDEEESVAKVPNHNDELMELCDTSMLTGRKLKQWWNSAESEERLYRLLAIFYLMLEILEVDLTKWRERSQEVKKHPLARPIISRLIWPYSDHGNPSTMLIKMIINMYVIAFRNDQFECLRCFEKVMSFIADVLPTSVLDKGDGFPPDSHQRRVFAHQIADALIESGLDDNNVEIALARIKPAWLRLIVGSKILCQRSREPSGDLPRNVAQLTQMILQGLSWGNMWGESSGDSSEEESKGPSTSGQGRKKKTIKRNSKGETQLHILARTGKTKKLEELMSKEGGHVNLADYAGWTPVHEAVTHGNLDCVRVLCSYKAPARSQRTSRHENMIMDVEESSQHSRPSATVNLHSKGGEMGLTPLHEAVIQNRVDIANLLLEFGGSSLLNDTTNAGLSPLDLAPDDAMLKVLLSRKEESRLAEKKFIFNLKSNVMGIQFSPSSRDCIALRCMLLQCYLESHCLWDIMKKMKTYKKDPKKNKSCAVKNVDYLEYSHDIKALESFVKCIKARMSGNITFPEACLVAFLC